MAAEQADDRLGVETQDDTDFFGPQEENANTPLKSIVLPVLRKEKGKASAQEGHSGAYGNGIWKFFLVPPKLVLMPGAKCKICAAKERADAETAIASGVSVREVARKFGLPYSSLDRHQRNCVPKVIAKVRDREARKHGEHAANVQQTAALLEENLSANLVNRVERLQTITDSIIERAMAQSPASEDGEAVRPDYGLALKAVDQARRNLELIGRLTGTLEPPKEQGEQLITFETFAMLYRRVRLERT